MAGLLIIVCLASRRKHFMHIHEENKFNNIKITVQKWGRNGKTGATTLDCHWKSRENWVGGNCCFWSSNNAHAIFCLLQQRSLTYTNRCKHTTHYDLRPDVLYYNLTIPIERAIPIHYLETSFAALYDELCDPPLKLSSTYWEVLRAIMFHDPENTVPLCYWVRDALG